MTGSYRYNRLTHSRICLGQAWWRWLGWNRTILVSGMGRCGSLSHAPPRKALAHAFTGPVGFSLIFGSYSPYQVPSHSPTFTEGEEISPTGTAITQQPTQPVSVPSVVKVFPSQPIDNYFSQSSSHLPRQAGKLGTAVCHSITEACRSGRTASLHYDVPVDLVNLSCTPWAGIEERSLQVPAAKPRGAKEGAGDRSPA